MDVIRSMFASRAFVTALVSMLGLIVIRIFPDMKPYVDELSNYIIILALVVIGGWKLEDAAEKFNARPMITDEAKIEAALQTLIAPDNTDTVKTETVVAKDAPVVTTTTTTTKPDTTVDIKG